MAGWSSLAKLRPNSLIFRSASRLFDQSTVSTFKNGVAQQIRHGGGGHNVMPITPSRWQWHKFKDMVHYYIMVGLIPVSAAVLYANIFVGPAQLAEIPESYVPKHWEYYRHPIQRFFARYVYNSPQQEYEKYMHLLYEEDEKRRLRLLEKKVREKMNERNDYQAYYYRPAITKYYRIMHDEAEKNRERAGDL